MGRCLLEERLAYYYACPYIPISDWIFLAKKEAEERHERVLERKFAP
jgi:hypothetical protein